MSIENEEFTELEQEAIEKGWNPGQRKSAAEWLAAGPYVNTIKSLQSQVDELAKYNAHIKENEYNRAKADLKAQITQAASIADAELVTKLSEELAELPSKHDIKKEQPVIDKFKLDNSDWFNDSTEENERMMDLAKLESKKLATKHPELSNEEHLRKVKQVIEKTFSHRFRQPDLAPPVLRSDETPVVKQTVGLKDLAPHYQIAWNALSKRNPNADFNEFKAYIKDSEKGKK